MPKQSLEFGPFEFDPARSLLFRGGVPVPVGRRSAALLSALLARRGEVLGKTELMDAAWQGVVVEEANLSVQIAALRKALGKRSDGREWVATVQRVGYRFLPVAEARPTAAFRPVLAILPFSHFETGAQSECDGFVEDLATAISRLGSVAVVARISSFEARSGSRGIPQIARALDANYLVEGSVRRTRGRLRTNVQLIDGETGSHIWAQTFDGDSDDGRDSVPLIHRVAAILEPKIYAAETSRLQSKLSDGLSAYDLYLRAQQNFFALTETGNAAAYRLLQRALELEPNNILTLGAAAGALHHRISVGWPALTEDDWAASLQLAQHGIELAGNDGASLAIFSSALFTARAHDVGRATMDRAVHSNGNSVAALCAAGLGHLFLGENERAETYYERAVSLGDADPGLCFSLGGLASIQRRRGNYERAIDLATRSVAASPCYSAAHWHLIASATRLGRVADAKRYLKRFREISPSTTVSSIRAGQPVVDERLIVPLLDALAEAGLPEA